MSGRVYGRDHGQIPDGPEMMGELVLAARLVLAACFGLAAVAKLADREGATSSLAGFGVPGALVSPASLVLPAVELVIAVALIATPTATVAAAAALCLLAIFSVALGVRLARGERPECHCFGRLSVKPVSWSAMARNAALGGIAAVVVLAGPGTSATAWTGDLGAAGRVGLAAGLVLVTMAAAFSWLALHLLRQHGRLLLRLEALEGNPGATRSAEAAAPDGLPVGAPAPSFELRDVDGTTVALEALRDGDRPVLLVFSDARCAACDALLPRVAAWQHEREGALKIALVAAGDEGDLRAKRQEHDLGAVLVDPPGKRSGAQVASQYGVAASPSAVLVDGEGRVASPAVGGEEAIAALVADASTAPAPSIGDPAPEIALTDLDGDPVDLDHDGKPTLIAFWDPSCPTCDAALAELRDWEGEGPDARLIVISRGDPEANAGLGVAAPVALDPDNAVTHAFGVSGTPSAVLVDGGGAIASPIAEGRSAIRVLIAMSARRLEEVRA